MKFKIALVEDEKNLRENYKKVLEKNNYKVSEYSNADEAIEAFKNNIPDLAILDIMLGAEKYGGFRVCKELRKLSLKAPIIFLTALSEEYDRISALKLGAWDYLTKDISLLLFITKINSIFNIIIHHKNTKDNITKNKDIELNKNSWKIIWKGKEINLTMTEFLIIEVLVENEGRTISQDALMAVTRQKVVTENTIVTHIRHIRTKFTKVDTKFNCIITTHGRGYSWEYH